MVIWNTRQHEHQVNVIYPVKKDGCVWLEKRDQIYYLVENSVCKVESPVTTRNELCDCFKIPKKHIMSIDFVILYGCSFFDFRKTKN